MAKHEAPIPCPEHRPVQHRDGRPPWCRACGHDATGREPVRAFRPGDVVDPGQPASTVLRTDARTLRAPRRG